ncbi:MAG: outer membrane beta-barrel protein, partial [Candidatus Marinimicrobia bacterium]|nr:outer membrane beta-barrel protein [Candidatus Neomarinimicrobiota bacterium]
MIKRSGHYISTVIFILLTSLISTFAQSSPPRSKGVVSGFVIETSHQKPVEYANVVLYSQKNKEQITGTITDENGYFRLSGLRFGMYLLEIKFIGYDAFSMDSLLIRPSRSVIDLGRIAIKLDVLVMDGVEVLGEKPVIEFKIDKKIINVSKQFTSLSGTAVDVLENVPSVSVDIEGNVSLRGSGSFNLLIDGRPSILDPNDALQAIPASTIENIEIVTNPSARFDPDGVAGIINIITKKNKLQGFSGIGNLNAGLYGQYGGDFLLNFRKNRYNFYIAANVNRRNMPGEMQFDTRTYLGDTTSFLNSAGESEWGGTSKGIRGGVDINLSTADLLSFSFRYGSRSRGRSSEMDYEKWTEPGDSNYYYTSINSSDRCGKFYSLNLDYRHNFKKEGHELNSQINLRRRDMEEDSRNELLDVDNQINSGQRSTEAGPGTRLRFKLDYILPVNKDDRIEAGYQLRYSLSEDENSMYKWKPDSGDYVFQSDFSHSTDYTRNIQSTYLIYAG